MALAGAPRPVPPKQVADFWCSKWQELTPLLLGLRQPHPFAAPVESHGYEVHFPFSSIFLDTPVGAHFK
jgi:hypothetical protein